MFTKLLTLCALFVSAFCLSIGTVSEQNVKKREASSGDSFPDWVPFKNKHGDELGEFVQVEKKNKVKKRLAPPMNFLLRAVAEPEGDDYYDKSGGESDGEEYFEKKDWSDLNRLADAADKKVEAINHTDISDIDGVVNILTKHPEDSIIEAINGARNFRIKEKEKVEPEISETEEITTQSPTTAQPTTTEKDSIVEKTEKRKYVNNEEESEGGDDYEDSSSVKAKKPNPEEDKESEARKAKILSSVDKLKERHAEEQRELSKKIREENLYKDEFGKNNTSYKTPDRFLQDSSEETERYDKRTRIRNRRPTAKPDYDEYEDLNSSVEDKYKVNVFKTEMPPSSTEKPSRIISTDGHKKSKHIESGKFSVFKNPRLFMVYDDSEETTIEPITSTNINNNYNTTNKGQQKFSSRYKTSTSPTDNDERISLLPVDSKAGEPTLFFPKSRKNRRKKTKTTTPVPITDSSVAETVTDNYKQTTALDIKSSWPDVTESESIHNSTAPDSTSDVTSSDFTAPEVTRTEYYDSNTGTDTASTNLDAVTDAIPASSDHKKEKNEDYNKEQGSGREHHSEHSEEHEEHGKKAYEGHHEDTKTAKGHHDKDNHLGKYDDHGGVDKQHKEESGHYGDHHHEEHGKKHAKYEESGKHSKGHSTKGSHDIHKKEEYEKKVEFFEEDGDSDEEEKHGGYNHEQGHSEGKRFKNGNLKAGHEKHSKGESGHFDKGGHEHTNKGHKQANGYDGHHKHGHEHGYKAGKEGGKKWIYHHGYPAKTANLVVIDRRGDQFYHGPHYYG